MITGLDRTASSTGRGVRAVMSLVALVLLVVGVPTLLTRLGAALPIDVGALAPGAWLRADDGRALLLLLLIAAWASWAVMVASVVLEVLAVVRRVPAPALPGLALPQRWAASLVAAVLLAITSSAGVGAPAVATGVAGQVPALRTAVTATVAASGFVNPGGARPAAQSGALAAQDHFEEAEPAAQPTRTPKPSPVVTTARHDTLWLLAEQHLGSGERFVEIVALNRGVPQPDGRSLGDDGRVYPGWTLTLPADAKADAPRPDRHRVVRGDTLWQIAEDELGDPTRYEQIVALNDGDLQPDGLALADPDLILPGWVLELPDDGRSVDDAGQESAATVESGADQGPDGTDQPDHSDASADQPDEHSGGHAADGEWDGREQAPDLDRGEASGATNPGRGDSRDADADVESRDAERGDSGSDPTGGSAPGPIDRAAQLGPTSRTDADSPDQRASMIPLDRSVSDPETPAAAPAPAPEVAPAPTGGSPRPAQAAPDSTGRAQSAPAETAGPTSSATPQPAAATPVPGVLPSADLPSAVAGTSPHPGASGSDRTQAASPETPELIAPETASFSLPAGGAVGALLLLGFGAELVRRRQQFQRYRRPGEPMPEPSADAQVIEATARDAAHEAGPDLLTRSLAQLAAESARSGQPMPDIRLVRSTPESVTLDLATPAEGALAPFHPVDPSRWTLDPGQLATQLPASGRNLPPGLPGLVTLGFTGDETILVNLESVGTLAVTGPDALVADVLRGIAAELALGPASRSTERVLCVADAQIAAALEPGAVEVDADPDRVEAALRSTIERRRSGNLDAAGVRTDSDLLGAARAGAAVVDRARAESTDEDPEGDPVLVVLCDRRLGVDVLPNSGCALITAAFADSVGATLAVQSAGSALLLPERQVLAPLWLSAGSTECIVDALECADLPAVPAPSTDDGFGPVDVRADQPEPAVIDLRELVGSDRDGRRPGVQSELFAVTLEPSDGGPEDSAGGPGQEPGGGPGQEPGCGSVGEREDGPAGEPEDGSAESATPARLRPSSEPIRCVPATGRTVSPAPRVLLLGEVLVENAHGAAESTRLGRLAETAAFVALNPGARPSELQSALWPGRRSNPQTCRQMISRARTWLGRTDQGESYLMPFSQSEGRLRLRAEVGSDWDDFQRLAALGMADPSDIDHLTEALAMVRGRPFGAVASRELPWADLHINQMISLITDVAHALAARHERAGRHAAAGEAALRGLQTESEAQALEEIVARTAP